MTNVQQVRDDEGLERKPQSKQNINPGWFPSQPPFYGIESRLFFFAFE